MFYALFLWSDDDIESITINIKWRNDKGNNSNNIDKILLTLLQFLAN